MLFLTTSFFVDLGQPMKVSQWVVVLPEKAWQLCHCGSAVVQSLVVVGEGAVYLDLTYQDGMHHKSLEYRPSEIVLVPWYSIFHKVERDTQDSPSIDHGRHEPHGRYI